MESPFALFALFSLLLISSTIDARPDPREYWKDVMKDQSMPEAIEGLIHKGSVDCSHTSAETKTNDKPFVKELEPRPNVSVYHDDEKLAEDKSFVKDFEPRPNVSAYHDDDKKLAEDKSHVKDFEPRPNVSVYNDGVSLKGEKPFAGDFEPKPNIFLYHD